MANCKSCHMRGSVCREPAPNQTETSSFQFFAIRLDVVDSVRLILFQHLCYNNLVFLSFEN